jgi:hypothetical protein
MARALQKKNIRNVPPEVKCAVVEYAAAIGRSRGEAIAEILNDYFEGELGNFKPTWEPKWSGDQLHFFCTARLAGKIWRASRKTGETESSFMIGVLAQFFGLEYEPVMKGSRRVVA